MNDKIAQYTCRHGTFRALSGDDTIGRCLDLYGEWSEPEICLFSKLLRHGDTVLEAGANIGTHTVALSRMVGEDGNVHAFEPMNVNHRLLSANLLDNSCFSAKTYQAALGSCVEIVEFPDADVHQVDNFGAFGFYTACPVPKVTCPQLTVDTLNLSRLDFLKIDTEGHERQVIEGAMSTIRRCRPMLYLESLNDHAASLSPDGHVGWVIDKLSDQDYAFWHYITPLFVSDNWRGHKTNHFQGVWSMDLIAIPKEVGFLQGLSDAETHPLYCDDPDQWRRAAFTRAQTTLVSELSTLDA